MQHICSEEISITDSKYKFHVTDFDPRSFGLHDETEDIKKIPQHVALFFEGKFLYSYSKFHNLEEEYKCAELMFSVV